MKIGFVHPQREQAWDKIGWIATEAVAAGHDVYHASHIHEVRTLDGICDVLIFEQLSAGLNAGDLIQVSKGRKSFWVQWWFDLFERDHPMAVGWGIENQSVYQDWHHVMRAMDLNLVKELDIIPKLAHMGILAARIDQGVPSAWPRSDVRLLNPEFDIMVIGRTGYEQRQADAAALVAAGFKLAWTGHYDGRLPKGITHFPKVPPDNLHEVMENARIALSVDRCCRRGYCSDRLYLLAACGCCIMDRWGAWKPNVGQVSYGGASVLDLPGPVEVATALLDAPGQIRAFASKTRGKVFGHHTYRHRLASLLRLIAYLRRVTPQDAIRRIARLWPSPKPPQGVFQA